MARAILGEAVRIIGASFSGNAAVSGVSGQSAVLSTGADGKDARETSYIDIDFVADADALDLDIKFHAEDVPNDLAQSLLRDSVSIWVNGSPSGIRAPAQGSTRVEKAVTPSLPIADGDALSIGYRARLGLSKGQLNTIRIATASLGAAAIFQH
jgi:hypothetical protein